jgi:DNA (cytosine-5)-methyltransferase 1
MKYNYDWTLKDAVFTKDKGKIFSCFACGGGSTMGYKLAGFDVIGMNEIDPRMAECYIENHHPKYSYIEPIQDFKNREDLPNELYDLDILDGSPPCSSFSMAGNRDKDWGKEKKFREGQADQVLDTLFFDFIDLAKKLQPKVVIAENVKGLLIGEAKEYVSKILIAFDNAGYFVDYKLLDASKMGVPQKRERVFFYAIRKDLYNGNFVDLFQTQPYLDLSFNEKKIPYKEIETTDIIQDNITHIPAGVLPYWEKIEPGRSCADVHEKGHFFQELKLHPDNPLPTLRAGGNSYYHYKIPRRLYDIEIMRGGSYPQDYNFMGSKPIYLVGMSVPPIMAAQIADRVYSQWLNI